MKILSKLLFMFILITAVSFTFADEPQETETEPVIEIKTEVKSSTDIPVVIEPNLHIAPSAPAYQQTVIETSSQTIQNKEAEKAKKLEQQKLKEQEKLNEKIQKEQEKLNNKIKKQIEKFNKKYENLK